MFSVTRKSEWIRNKEESNSDPWDQREAETRKWNSEAAEATAEGYPGETERRERCKVWMDAVVVVCNIPWMT